MQQVKQVTRLVPQESTPYVGEALSALREEVGGEATVLGFVGAPFTLASYIVEGKGSKVYPNLKRLMFSEPAIVHALLEKLAEGIADYVRYQVGLSSNPAGVREHSHASSDARLDGRAELHVT